MVETKSRRLRNLFYGEGPTPVFLGSNAIHAVMAERAGFSAFHLSGSWSTCVNLGIADAGMMTLTENVYNARAVASAVDIPIFADADDGYGNAVNVWRTTEEFIRAGVAGIHIEDQVAPKKAGNLTGKRLISDEEMIGKLRAACAVRDEVDPDFIIAARTDARGAEGGSMEEVIRRANLYREETGVDVIYFEALQDWAEIEYALARTPGPAFSTMNPANRLWPALSVQRAAGQKWTVMSQPLQRSLGSLWDEISLAARTIETDGFDDRPRGEFRIEQALRMSQADVRELEGKFLPLELQRNYGMEFNGAPTAGDAR